MKKHIFRLVAIGALVTLILVLWLNTEVTSAGTHEASVVLAESNAKITLRLQPMHPYLAEYRRFLVLQLHNGDQRSIELQPDTGGFARTQIYLFPTGRIAVQGYLDAAIASPSPPDLKLIVGCPMEASISARSTRTRTGNGDS
jgi:hypothetical protein